MEQPNSATWPDFAIALLNFIREEPWDFALALGIIAVFVLIVAVPVYLVVPRVHAMYKEIYRQDRERHKEPDLFNDD